MSGGVILWTNKHEILFLSFFAKISSLENYLCKDQVTYYFNQLNL